MRDLIFSPKFFPVCLIVLNGLAALRCLVAVDVGRTIYWFCALGLNYSITFMMK